MEQRTLSKDEIVAVEKQIKELVERGEAVIESRRTSSSKLTRDGSVIWLHVSVNRIRVLLAQKALERRLGFDGSSRE
jgi:hypothetical protein